MKVLVVHNTYQSTQVGGEDIVVLREIALLKDKLGHENVFEYIISNDEIRPLQLAMHIWHDPIHFENVYNVVKENQIDIVHVHNFFPLLTPSVFAAAKKAGAKVVHTLHNFRWWCSAGTLYRKKKGICEECVTKKFGWPGVLHGCYRDSHVQSLAANLAFTWYRIKKNADNIDAYFVLSHFQLEKLKSLLPVNKMYLKPNPIDVPVEILPIQQKKDYLYVGRLEPAKGIDLLLSTWSQLPQSFYLKIIGSGENLERLKKTYAVCHNILFLDQLPHEEVLVHVSKSKYLLHPSLTYETFGLTLLEALAHGTPVIGLSRGTRPEFIQSGKNGFLCQISELKATVMKANAVSDADYQLLCTNAVDSAKPFYPQQVIEGQVAHYQTILESA